MTINDPWAAPTPPTDGELKTQDPRVITNHQPGLLPCPDNPPPPLGWVYWKGPLPLHAGEFANRVEFNPKEFPVGSFVQTVLAGQQIAARVEWHDYQGMTGKHGCFRGTSLFRPVAPS
jgi:hypothetical protein